MLDRNKCDNCGCWREEHYRRDGSWNPDVPCSEYSGRDATAEELETRDADLARYAKWLSSPRRDVASAAPWHKS